MTTNEIITIIGIVLGCGGLWTFIQFLITRYDGRRQAMEDLQNAVARLQTSIDINNADMALQNEALMALAQDRILFLAKAFIHQKWISAEDYKNLKRMADSYRSLGGNDLVKVYMEMVDKLPKKSKE